MNRFALPVLAVLIALPAASRADLLTFDGNGNPTNVPVTNGYGGLVYNQFDLLNTTINTGAFHPAFPISSPEVLYDNYANTASFGVTTGSFTLNSLYLAGGDSTDSVTLTASVVGGGTDTATFTVSNSAASFETLNWSGITGVTFTTNPVGEYFAIDNVTINAPATSATPEPSSLALLGTGILSVAGAVRRKLRKA
jgi:hypothetical protein